MKPNSICSQCLRALRQASRSQTTAPRRTPNSSRLLSSTPYLSQQATSQQSTSQSQTPPIPPPTPRASSNPTAPPLKAAKAAKPSPPEPSTRQIQSHLRQSLTRPATFDRLAATLRSSARSATETYVTYGLTEALFKSCSSLVSYTIPEDQRTKILTGQGPPKTNGGEDIGFPVKGKSDGSIWFQNDMDGKKGKGIGMQPTFSTWAQVTYLHMYLLTVALRRVDSTEAFQSYQRYLLEHFSQDAEMKMLLLHTISARGIRNQYLKDLFLQWRGILAAYDEGMVEGDAVLGAAVWRNLFKGEEDVDWVRVGRVVAYMRCAVRELGMVEDVTRLGEVGALDGPDGVWARSWRAVDAAGV